ncbi:MAG TPA: sensor histidine kinase [Bacillota bacterium]|jgi:signal transduction histidine kinase
MSFWTFLNDRRAYVIAFVVSLFLGLAVIELDLTLTGGRLTGSNLWYAGLLAVLVLGLWVSVEYFRQRPFYGQLTGLQQARDPEAYARVVSPVTAEQALVRQALVGQHQVYADELAAHRRRQGFSAMFLNRWAHQMKTPIAVLDLQLQELERAGAESADPRGRPGPEAVASLREEVDKLAAGLELMLTNARLTDFTSDFVVHQADLAEVARAAINDQKRAFIRAGVFPRLKGVGPEAPGQGSAPAPPILVETDEKWLRFVLIQLLSNAIKYSRLSDRPEARQVTIQLSADRDQGPKAKPAPVRVTVHDWGIGIPPQDLGRVFEPFFTGENGRRSPEATGMGLYLAKQVCARLGHRLAVTSPGPGQGTVATVEFVPGETLHNAV